MLFKFGLYSYRFFHSSNSIFLCSPLVSDSETFSNATQWVLHLVVDILFKQLLIVVEHNFVVQQVFQLFCAKLVVFKVEIIRIQLFRFRFILRIMEFLKERMFKCFLDCNSFFRINHKHLFQKINCQWIVVCKKLIKRLNFRVIMNVFYNVELVAMQHFFYLLLCFFSEHFDDHFNLFNFVVSRKQWFA